MTSSTRDAGPRAQERAVRRTRLVYRASTGILCAVMVFSVVSFTFYDHFPFPYGTEGAFVHLGLPRYFKVELTIAKALGVLALLVPGVPRKVKAFAYAGFAITLVSAAIAHFARGDAALGAFYVLDPLVFLGVLALSYASWNRLAGGTGTRGAAAAGRPDPA